jgi:hypothetical protein
MTTPHDPAVAPETARRPTSRFGVQEHAETDGVRLDLPATATPPSPADTALALDAKARDRVLRMTRLNGSFESDDFDSSRDPADTKALMAVFPGLLDAWERARQLPEGSSASSARDAASKAVKLAVGGIWEKPRFRGSGKTLWQGKFAHGGAWSPDALALAGGGENAWKGRLELEHVVPRVTIAKIIDRMITAGRPVEDVTSAISEATNVIVVRMAAKGDQVRYQPGKPNLPDDVEARLIAHHVADPKDPAQAGDRLADEEWFELAFCRYLRPELRDTGGRSMTWRLDEVDTLTHVLSKK